MQKFCPSTKDLITTAAEDSFTLMCLLFCLCSLPKEWVSTWCELANKHFSTPSDAMYDLHSKNLNTLHRGQKFHSSAPNYEQNQERTSNSSHRTSDLGRITPGTPLCSLLNTLLTDKWMCLQDNLSSEIVSHSSCRTSAIFKYFCPLLHIWAATWDFQQCGNVVCASAKAQTSQIRSVWSELLLVSWIFYDS